MLRSEKEALIQEMNQTFNDAAVVVVTHTQGLDASQTHELRTKVREAGANFRVTKNRLTKIALKDTPYEQLEDLFKGPTAIAWSDDPVAAAKAAVDFAKENDKVVVIGGGMEGKSLSTDEVVALAKLPSLDELRAGLVRMIQTPATRLATVTAAPATQVARVLSAYSQKEAA
ncbi:MAG: 50S ribosomal protein L10 [Alphaproteobacteria bacterium]